MNTHQTHGVMLPVKDQSAEGIKMLNGLLKKGYASEKKKKEKFAKAGVAYKKNPSAKTLKAQRQAARLYLDSLLVRFVAVVRANRSLAMPDRCSLSECWEIAGELRRDLPIHEPVRVYAKPKMSGGFRPVSVFGIKYRAAQHLLKPLLEIHLMPRAWQYTHRGVHQAIEYIIELNPTADLHARKLDIVNHFGNFQEVDLVTFFNELPKEMVRKVILADTPILTNMDNSPKNMELSNQARQGVAQGSAISPLIAALSVSHLKWEPIEGVHLLNCADDFLLIAEDVGKLDKATSALTAAVAALPGGKFSLVPKNMLAVGDPTSTFGQVVTFLGHNMEICKDGTFLVTPCNDAYARFGDVTERILADIAKLTSKHQKSLAMGHYERMAELRSRIVYRIAELNKFVGGVETSILHVPGRVCRCSDGSRRRPGVRHL